MDAKSKARLRLRSFYGVPTENSVQRGPLQLDLCENLSGGLTTTLWAGRGYGLQRLVVESIETDSSGVDSLVACKPPTSGISYGQKTRSD